MSLLNKKYLFVHINKSGGGVITTNMKKNGKTLLTGSHRCLEMMLDIAKTKYNIDKDCLYIFTMVRNPYERMLSMYLFYHKNNYNAPEFFSGVDKIDNDFNKWIEYIYSEHFDRNHSHGDINIYKYCFCNQLNWLKNNNNKLISVNKIYKYEDKEYETLFKDIMKLRKYNLKKIHPTKHKHYSNYYNQRSIDLVTKHYKEDIDYFNYKFDIL